MSPTRHLYIHIPFCHRICPYCSFYKHTPGATDMTRFVDALLAELDTARKTIPLDLTTIYFGGGTPTALSETHLDRLLAGLQDRLDLSHLTEFGMETNPRTVTPSKAAMMRRRGVSRVSLGIQSWDPATLKTLGRDHAPADAEETWRALQSAGFDSLNIDLMFSIPGQSMETWRATLEHTLSLNPDHISAYNLNYEEDTDFFRRLQSGEFREDNDRDAEQFYQALDLLESAGFEHYEISNYAKPGKRSHHNESYWLGEDYLGIGPGAFSTIDSQRWRNVEDTTAWIERTLSGQSTTESHESLTPEQRRIERFGLELRTRTGLPRDLIHAEQLKMLDILAAEGLLKLSPTHLRLTRAGKPLVDSVAIALMGE